MASNKREVVEIKMDMTPMIDCVFLLLIFFMCATKFRVEEGRLKSYLPKNRGSGTGSATIDLKEVRIKLLSWAPGATNPYNQNTGCSWLVLNESWRDEGVSEDEIWEKTRQMISNGEFETQLKVESRVFENVTINDGFGPEVVPDFDALRDLLQAAMSNYTPPADEPERTLPVIIDTQPPVPHRFAVWVLNTCVEVGIRDVTFAAPSKRIE